MRRLVALLLISRLSRPRLAPTPINKTAIGCALFGLTLYGVVSVGFAALVLLFIYGLVVPSICIRHRAPFWPVRLKGLRHHI